MGAHWLKKKVPVWNLNNCNKTFGMDLLTSLVIPLVVFFFFFLLNYVLVLILKLILFSIQSLTMDYSGRVRSPLRTLDPHPLSTNCTHEYFNRPTLNSSPPRILNLRSRNQIRENDFFLENYVTWDGAVSHSVLYYQPLPITHYQVRLILITNSVHCL